MNELKQLVIILVSVALIGAVGLLFTQITITTTGDVYVDNYEANLYLNGTITERIDYVVNVPNTYKMLYRNLMAPLIYEGNTENSNNNNSITAKNNPHFELISLSVSAGTIPYVKDFQGKAMLISNSDLLFGEALAKTTVTASNSSSDLESRLLSDISSLANLNEVGSYKAEGYDAGTYEINTVFKLQPPLECNKEYCHLNLMLAREHLPYNRVDIQVHDPYGYISQVFVHSNTMSVSKVNAQDGSNTWSITGTSPTDSLLEFELLSNPSISNVMPAFTKEVSNIKDRTLSANTLFIVFPMWDQALKVIIILFPVIVLIIYYKFGKEKSFTIPKFLSFVPRTDRKPWLVNLVFKGDPYNYDIDGFYATLLDLHRRGIIEIETGEPKRNKNNDINAPSLKKMAKDHSLRIRVVHKDNDDHDDDVVVTTDGYEKQVLKFLHDNSEESIFDAQSLITKIQDLRREATSTYSRATSILREIHSQMDKLIKHPNKSPAKEFALGRRRYSWMIFGSCLIVAIISLLLFPGIYTSLILVFQSVPLLFASPVLFGRWKGEYYKEKLQWNAFRAFLSDLASIKKYAPQDIKIWQQWLVYATALGIADNVVRALRELDVKIPEVYTDTYVYAPLFFTDMYRQSHYIPRTDSRGSSTSWGGSGGGFGTGGGFGGGGAGAR